MNPTSGLRRHPREPIVARVRVSWAPSGGITQYVMCNAVDISESGLRINSKEALPVGQYVHFQIDGMGLRGPASVRSCCRNTAKHEDRARVFQRRQVEETGSGAEAGRLIQRPAAARRLSGKAELNSNVI